jgi:hypothetical protein
MHAWERVSSNAGARTPGIDKATVAWIDTRIGVEAFLNHIRDSLKSGGFQPVEVRQAARDPGIELLVGTRLRGHRPDVTGRVHSRRRRVRMGRSASAGAMVSVQVV